MYFLIEKATRLTRTTLHVPAKYIVLTLFFFAAFSAGYAQRTTAADSVRAIEEKLVALALNGPAMKEAEHRGKINQYQLQAAQNQWMNILSFSINYNDLNLAKQPTNTPVVFPRYFFGLTIPLGTLLSRTQIRSAKESIEISKANVEQLKRTITAEVLSKYAQYRAYNELITLQSELINDVQAQLLQTEEKFRKGTATIENYTAAQSAKNNELARLIDLRLQQQLVKFDIESMIGTSLESVTRR